MKQLNREQAIALYESGFWEELTDREMVEFQIEQDLLCMPFSLFHEAMSRVLGRPVYTHEFAFRDLLKKELLGEKEPATLEDIINLIPESKRVILEI